MVSFFTYTSTTSATNKMRKAFRTSRRSVYPPSLSITLDSRVVYHTLTPHPAFGPVPDTSDPRTVEEQYQNEVAYRQLLVQGALAVLLPTEDLGNVCLRTLVTDVVGELILGNGIGNKACEGWLLWEGITKVAENLKSRGTYVPEEMEANTTSRLEQFGLLSERNGQTGKHESGSAGSVSEVFWRIIQQCYLTFLAIRFVMVGLVAAWNSRPTQGGRVIRNSGRDSDTDGEVERASAALTRKRPIVSFAIFSVISSLLDLSSRTPWLVGSVSLLQYHLIRRPVRLGATGGLVDL
jgi:hypothetical protein